MKILLKYLLFIVYISLCACEPIRVGSEAEVFDPTVLIGQWSRIQDSTSIMTITEDSIDIYSDGQYVCKYTCVDFDARYFTLYMNRLWLDDNASYKKCSCMSSISSDYKTLYIRRVDPKMRDEDDYYYEDVVLIKM